MKASLAAVAVLLALAGCQTVRQEASVPDNSDASYELAKAVADTIGRCWFAANETAFAGYIYSPEPNNRPPRVLIVPKANPHDLPVLVVEAHSAAKLYAYGPLMDGRQTSRIRSDLSRWETGNSAC
jgi:hypothetical protein